MDPNSIDRGGLDSWTLGLEVVVAVPDGCEGAAPGDDIWPHHLLLCRHIAHVGLTECSSDGEETVQGEGYVDRTQQQQEQERHP